MSTLFMAKVFVVWLKSFFLATCERRDINSLCNKRIQTSITFLFLSYRMFHIELKPQWIFLRMDEISNLNSRRIEQRIKQRKKKKTIEWFSYFCFIFFACPPIPTLGIAALCTILHNNNFENAYNSKNAYPRFCSPSSSSHSSPFWILIQFNSSSENSNKKRGNNAFYSNIHIYVL